MRDVEPPYLRHNQKASYVEALCVIIDGAALGFLHTRTNLSPFTKDFNEEGRLDEYIGNFSRVLLRVDDFNKVKKPDQWQKFRKSSWCFQQCVTRSL